MLKALARASRFNMYRLIEPTTFLETTAHYSQATDISILLEHTCSSLAFCDVCTKTNSIRTQVAIGDKNLS
jgi:hypothetical protein